MTDKNLISIGEAAKIAGVTVQTLRRWDESGKLVSQKSIGGQRRYLRAEVESISPNSLYHQAKSWATATIANPLPPELYCQTRAELENRVQRLSDHLFSSGDNEDRYALIIAAIGEIGNNSFDHNIGSWPDVPGVFFGHDMAQGIVVLADRGQGILATLKRVRPDLTTHTAAIKVAFTEVVTGRAPEKRGNGLKLVKKFAQRSSLIVDLQSGDARLHLSESITEPEITIVEPSVRGTLTTLRFTKNK